MREFFGLVYALSILIAIVSAIGTVLGMLLNGARGNDLTGVGISLTIFFGLLAWAALYFAGMA